jgi:hypothetical protein
MMYMSAHAFVHCKDASSMLLLERLVLCEVAQVIRT